MTKKILFVILKRGRKLGGIEMAEQRVTGDMNIMEAVDRYPIIAQVLMRYGLGCIGCFISSVETLAEGIAVHGLNPDIIIDEINMILEKQG